METPETIANALPHVPGVYLFKDAKKTVLYVGKAKDLRRRVKQYFDKRGDLGVKTEQLVSHIVTIDTIQTHSEFDALLLEAKLIRDYNPKYNIIAKDDKSPLYLGICFDEELPHILYVRKSGIIKKRGRIYFGPFQSGRTIRKVAAELRHITPFCMQKIRSGAPCFYSHLGLCNPCPSRISHMDNTSERKELTALYRKNVRRMADILSGKSLTVLHSLEKQMQQLSQEQKYEEALKVKTSIERLQQVRTQHYDPLLYMQGSSFLENVYESEMEELHEVLERYYPDIRPLRRVECIDISNTMGEFATGSLVVLDDGRPSPSDYRRFRVRAKQAPNDFAMIAEIVTRRLRHTEWELPQLLVVDGGKGQVGSAREVLVQAGLEIPLIGLAKRFEEIIIPTRGNTFATVRLSVDHKGLHLLERIRDESHRFALTYHRLLRKQNFLRKEKSSVV